MSTKTIPTAHTYGEEIDNIGIAQTTYRGRDARLVSGSPITPFDVEWHHHRGGEVIDVYDVRSHVGGTYPAGAWVVESLTSRAWTGRTFSLSAPPNCAKRGCETTTRPGSAEAILGTSLRSTRPTKIVERDVRGYMTVLREITR